MSGEGDLDSTESHSQLLVGTLPLTDRDPPENPEDKDPPQNPPVEGLASCSSENNTRDKKSGNTPPTEKSKQVVDSPSEYPPQDHPEIPIDPGENLKEPSSKRSQKVPIADPFPRFWSGETADASDKDKKRHRWLTRKPKTPIMENTPLAPSIRPSPHLQTQPLITPSGKKGENMDNNNKIIRDAEERIPVIEKKRQELEEQNRKVFHPSPIEGIDIGGAEGLETLDPEISIPTEEDFVLPPPLESFAR